LFLEIQVRPKTCVHESRVLSVLDNPYPSKTAKKIMYRRVTIFDPLEEWEHLPAQSNDSRSPLLGPAKRREFPIKAIPFEISGVL
jgi:hypothetical protein